MGGDSDHSEHESASSPPHGGDHDAHTTHAETTYRNNTAQRDARYVKPRPSLASQQHIEEPIAFDNKEAFPALHSNWQRFGEILGVNQFVGDPKFSGLVDRNPPLHNYLGFWDWLSSSAFVLKPINYVSMYERPNPCPEEWKMWEWTWNRTKFRNPKIPPPINGEYTDQLHVLAFQEWCEYERKVYIQHCCILRNQMKRCAMKESRWNGAKNCKHLYNKYFAMTRGQEMANALMYMSLTGNCAIRDTPYPPDFDEKKRKMFNDWLFRTQLKKPSDPF